MYQRPRRYEYSKIFVTRRRDHKIDEIKMETFVTQKYGHYFKGLSV